MSKLIDRITSHHLRDRETATGAVQVTSAKSPARKERAAGLKGVHGYRHMRRFAAILIAAACLLGLAATSFADSERTAQDSYSPGGRINTKNDSTDYDDPTYEGPFTVSGVHQSTSTTSGTTFGSAMPLSTIYIDMAAIDGQSPVFTKLADASKPMQAGFADGIMVTDNGMAIYNTNPSGGEVTKTIVAGKDTYLPGNLFSFTYKDAAILADGSKANVVITYSNAHIFIDQRQGEDTYDGVVSLATGRKFTYSTPGSSYYNNAATRELVTGSEDYPITNFSASGINLLPMMGGSMDARIQVVDASGNPVEGTFICPTVGINLDRSPVTSTASAARPLWYLADRYPEYEYFSEAMRINSGTASDIYLTSNEAVNEKGSSDTKDQYYWPKVAEEASGVYQGAVKFTSRSMNYTNKNASDECYSSGFVTTADAAAGISLTGTGHGSVGYTMNTSLMSGVQIWQRIRSVTGPGGNIQTTSEGNYGGDLSDGGDILGPGTYVVPQGKTVTYTMTPDAGYALDELRINNEITGVPTIISGVADMQPGDTMTYAVETGKTVTITKNADGSYTCEFPENNHDHTIMVTWVPDTDAVMVEATKKWFDKNNVFETRDDIIVHVNGMAEYDSGESHYYPADFLPAQKFAPGTVADKQEDWNARWGDGKKNNHDYTGAVNGETVYRTKAALPQEVEGKTQYYFYDYAKRQFRAYTYNSTKGEFVATDTYYWVNFLPKYDESGKQITYTVEEEVPDGYDLAVTTNNKGRVSETMADYDYTLNNTLEPVGTVKVKATKALEGRPFNGNDEFIFVLAGKHGSPMPVETAVKIPAEGEDEPERVAQKIKPTAGTVLAEVDFGVISYRKSDLSKHKVEYATASGEQKAAIRYWTVKDSQTEAENRTYDMADTVDAAAFDNLDSNVKASATGTSYEKVFHYNVTENPQHPDHVENDTAVLNMTVRVFYNELENKIYVEDEDTTDTKNGVQDITAEKREHLTTPEVTLHRDFFTNKYDNKTTWDPEITKTLNGRPISKDQFKDYFTIKAITTTDTQASETPMPGDADEATGEYPHGGTAGSNSWEMESASEAPRGTNDIKAIVGFDTITYTNDDLKVEVEYSDVLKNRVISWEKGNTVYGPIPADAKASVTAGEDGSKASVRYDDATEAQRKEAETTGWVLGGKTYIDLNTMSESEQAAALAGSRGSYYPDSRVFTYKIWESGSDTAGYKVDKARDTEGEAYVVEVTVTRDNVTGKLTATPSITKDDLKFENRYEAKGDVVVKAFKKIKGRDLKDGEFKFEIEAITAGAPLPVDTETTNEADGTVKFDKLTFTQDHLKKTPTDSPGEYDALRTVDGYYEKTFLYKITETSTDAHGVVTDKNAKTVAVTVREDNKGNITVVAVNGNADAAGDEVLGTGYEVTQDKAADGKNAESTVRAGIFTNEYSATGDTNIPAIKLLQGGKLEANQFYFTLEDAKGNILGTVGNAANGSVTFPLTYNLDQVRKDVTDGKCTTEDTKAPDNGKWTYTYNMKELKVDGRGTDDITYDATGTGEGYTVTVEVTDDGEGNLTAEITSDPITFTNTVKTRSLTIQKVWVDYDADGISKVKRPESVKYTVEADVPAADMAAMDQSHAWNASGNKSKTEITLTKETDEKKDALWSKTVKGLPRYKADGTEITYEVTEEELPNYKTETVVLGDTYSFINTYVITEISGTKVWVDGGLPHAVSADLDGQLTVKWTDANDGSGTVEDPHIDYDNAASSYTVIGLQKYSDDGALRTYYVEETQLDGYKAPKYTNTGDFADKTDAAYDGGTITNTITGKTDVTGTKVWKDKNGGDLAPETAPTLHLYRRSAKEGAAEEEVTAEPVWNSTKTEYTFAKQDKYDDDGYEYEYWVKEDQVSGYLPPEYSDGDKAKNEGVITNIKEPTGTLDIAAIKVLTGSTRLSDWNFELSLYTGPNGTGALIGGPVTVPAGTLSDDGKSESADVTFDDIYFRIITDNDTVKAQMAKAQIGPWVDLVDNHDGTYGTTLYVYETPITAAGLTQPGDGGTPVDIVVTNNHDGTLSAHVAEAGDEKVTAGNVINDNLDGTVLADAVIPSGKVKNKHEQTVDADINIEKILNGRDLKADDAFTFTAAYQPNTSLPAKEQARLTDGLDAESKSITIANMTRSASTADADHPYGTGNNATGKVTFTFDKTGVYKFNVTESGEVPGVTNDTKAGEEVTVTVTKNADGTLNAAVAYADGAEADFTNIYNAKGDATVIVRKLVNGEVWNEDMNFWFDLEPLTAPDGYTTDTMPKPETKREAARQTAKETTDKRATWSFGEFKLADAGKRFVYKVTEDTPNFKGFDPAEWDLDITLPQGQTYHTITVVPKDKGDGTLTFDLYYDSATAATSQPLQVTNRKKGTSRNFFASKDVVDSKDNSHWPKALGSFDLVLTATDGGPMPEDATGSTKTVSASDTRAINFGTISFDNEYQALINGTERTFTYTVTENTTPAKPGVEYGVDDTSSFTITVKIAKNDDGTPGGKDGSIVDPYVVYKNTTTGEIIYTTADGGHYPVIKNKYTAEGEISLALTKKLEGCNLAADAFSFTLYDANKAVAKDKDGHDIKNKENAADGKVTLGTLKFTESDVENSPITYNIREDIPVGAKAQDDESIVYAVDTTLEVRDAHIWVKDGVTYDPEITHPVTITLSDKGDGTLDIKVSPENAEDKTSITNKLPVTNYYEAEGKQIFQVYKYLEERPIRRVGFTFELKGLDGAPMPVGVRDDTTTTKVLPGVEYSHDGRASFADIVYTMDDLKKADGTYESSKTFKYEIREVPADTAGEDGLTYADTVYTATVTVSNAQKNGELYVTVRYDKKSGNDSKYGDNEGNAPDEEYGDNGTVDFTNIYDSNGSATMNLAKTILGRAWQNDDEFTLVVEPLEGASYIGGGDHKQTVDDNMVPLPGNTIVPAHRDQPGNPDDSGEVEVVVSGADTAIGAASRLKVTDEIKFTDDMLTYDSADGYLKGTFIYKVTEDTRELPAGFTQTEDSTTTYYVRVDVVDDRMGHLDTTVSYYDSEAGAKAGTGAIGTAPLFSNTYDATGEADIPVKKFVDMGSEQDDRGWALLGNDDKFGFTAAPVGEGPAVTPTTLYIDKNTAEHKGVFKVAPIELSMLTYTTSAKNTDASGNTIKYSDDSDVRKDVQYMTFIGHVKEDDLPASIKGVDKDDTEVFVKLIAIDKLDGTIDTQWKFYSDPSCTQELDFDRTDDPDDIEFTNIYRDVMDMIVEKTWHDDGKDETVAARPDIKIQLTRHIDGGNIETLMKLDGNAKLYAKGGETEITYVDGEASVAADQLPVTFKDLPANDGSGHDYIYEVVETYVGEGYYQSQEPKVIEEGSETEARTIELTNSMSTKVHVQKLWKDDEDTSKRGNVVIAALYRNGTLMPNNVHLMEPDGWQTVYEDLPMYDDDNKAITYTAREMAVPEEYYTSLVEYSLDNRDWSTELPEDWDTDAEKYIRITNILLRELEVTKKWEGIPVVNVTYELYRTTKEKLPAIETDPKTGITKEGDLWKWTPNDKWEKVMEKDGRTPRTHIFTTDDFYDGEDQKESASYTFKDLERYDKDDSEYVYRVYEATSGEYFTSSQEEGGQASNTTVLNTNEYTGRGEAYPNVVKELKGRRWLDTDKFYFKIEPIKGIDDDGKPIDFEDTPEDQEAKAKVPLPDDGSDPGTDPDDIAVADLDKPVGAIGRSVDFNKITFVSGDGEDAHVKEGGFADYFYKIYEVDKDGDPKIGGKTVKGITYTDEVHTLRISLSDDGLGGDKSITTQRYWDGAETSSAVPVYVNTYKAYGVSYGYVIKRIAGRNFKEGDEFTFKFANVSGSPVRTVGPDDPGTTDPTEGTVDPISYDEGVYVDGSAGQYKASGVDSGADKARKVGIGYLNSDDLVADPTTGKLKGTFLYQFHEESGSVSDLEYDDNLIYLRLTVEDNEDGTLKIDYEYFLDAACTQPLEGREKHEPKLLVNLETGEIAPAGAEEGETYGYIASGYFRNRTKIDIPIAKKWVKENKNGELIPADPIDSVTVNLRRMAVFVNPENGKYYNQYHDGVYSDPVSDDDLKNLDKWEAVGTPHTFTIGDFYTQGGDLKDHADYTFEGVEAYEHNDAAGVPTGKIYIYRVREATGSDAYASWYEINGVKKPQWYDTDTKGDKVIVYNETQATNVANIAAVKQLIGRDWLDQDGTGAETDRYHFTLTPLGRGAYDAQGELIRHGDDVEYDTRVETNIPMPEDKYSSEATGTDDAVAAKQTQFADGSTPVEEVVGEGERLARFGEITYKLDDLVYNEKTGRMQGDFFYELKEVIPTDTKGVTYDGKKHKVHVKVRENRTKELVVQIAYDDKQGDIDTGTKFTPVFTNRYNATATPEAAVDKYIMGRNWAEGDRFTFSLAPIGGAPAITSGEPDAITTEISVTDREAGSSDKLSADFDFGTFKFKLSDLNKVTQQSGEKQYSTGGAVPAGTKYGVFYYAVEETDAVSASGAAKLGKDKDTEYVQFTVIDKGDGTLDIQSGIFEDRYGREPRYVPGSPTDLAENASFVNQALRDITVTKVWRGDPAGDAIVTLQYGIPQEGEDPYDWRDYDSYKFDRSTMTPAGEKDPDVIHGLTVPVTYYEHVFSDLPVYYRDGDVLDLNDPQLGWRVVEHSMDGVETYYGVTPEVKYDDRESAAGYDENADVAHDEGVDQLDGKLYVTNVNAPVLKDAEAKVRLVKDIEGREWDERDAFKFTLTPVGIGTYNEDGVLYTLANGKVDRDKLKMDGETVITDIPMPGVTPSHPDPTNATAKIDGEHPEYELTDSQWLAYFDDIIFKSGDLALIGVKDGEARKEILMGDFFYDMTEVIPGEAVAFDNSGRQVDPELKYENANAEQKAQYTWVYDNMAYDNKSHEVRVHVERVGNNLTATVSYDGEDVGGAVPVYTNYEKENVSTEVHVMKKWDDNNDQERKRPAEGARVRVTAEGWDGKDIGGVKVEDILLNDENNRKDVFKKLPKENDAGRPYEYQVVEIDPETGEVLENGDETSYGYQVAIKRKDHADFVITNSYTPEELSVEVSKVWNDSSATEEERSDLRSDVTVHLYGFKDEQVVYYAGSKKIEMNSQGEPKGAATFTKLPKRYFNKDDLEWKVVEDPVYGYTAKVEYQSESTQQWTETVPEDWNRQARVVNTYAKPVTTVTAVKKWEDSDNNDGKRPESVTFQLWRKVGDEDPEHVEDKDKTVTADTQEVSGKPWSAKWTNLPTTTEVDTKDGQGETVVQDKTRVEYQDVYQDKTGGPSIKKDAYDKLSPKGRDTYVEDGQGGYVNKDDPSETIDQATYDALTPKGQNDYELEQNVPKQETEEETVKKEVPVLYVVKEVYEGGDDAHNLKKLGYEKPMVHATDKPGEFEIVNVHVPETTDVHVVKVWADQDDHDGIRPDHIGLKLMDDQTEVRKVSITEEDKWLLDGDKPAWSHTFKGVPVYDKGREIDYSVTESGVPEGYTSKTEDTTPEGADYKQFTITNTHADDSLMKLTVNKVWAGDDEDKSHRDDVKLRLIKVIEGARKDMGDEYAKELKYDPDEPDKPMTDTWENLPTSEKGKIVSYTVEEEPIAGYAVTYSDVTRKEAAPEEGDNPKEKGWFEKVGDKYVPTEDETVDPDKTYYTDECEVTVTNTFNSGGGELSGDVLYVDPKNEAGQMIVGSTRYGTKNQAESAAEKQQGKPADPKHAGYNFLGWALNKDENDNWVLVATYSEVAPAVKPITTYIDPQSGKPLLVSGTKIKKPANPKHDGMVFVKWVKVKDAAGNTIYVAKYKCAAKGSSTSAPPKTYTQREQNLQRVTVVDTGDGAQLPLMVLFLTVSGAFAAAVIIRRRREDACRDDAA